VVEGTVTSALVPEDGGDEGALNSTKDGEKNG